MSMSSYAKMAMMRRGQSSPRNAYDGGVGGAYNRVTDRNVGGRPVDDTGGKVYDRPAEGNYGIENRRDSRGRYAPRNAYEGGQYRMGHDDGWVVKPIHQEAENRYRMGDDGGRMIGFEGGMESRMRMGREHHEDTDRMQMGGSEGEEGHQKLDKRTAMEWVNRMENSDKSRGEHFTMEQTERVRKNKGWECDPVEFWVAMNAMWSDGAQTARKFGVDKLEYWAERAKEFLDDEDAVPDKMAKYYKYIVKKG